MKLTNLERTVRIKNGFLEMTETKRERDGPRAINAYPIPAATVIVISLFLSLTLFLSRMRNEKELVFCLDPPLMNQDKKHEDGVSDLLDRIIDPVRFS
jgi:hypothetical protein